MTAVDQAGVGGAPPVEGLGATGTGTGFETAVVGGLFIITGIVIAAPMVGRLGAGVTEAGRANIGATFIVSF